MIAADSIFTMPPSFKPGCLPRKTKCGHDPIGSPVFEDAITPIPRTQWPELLAQAPSVGYRVDEIKDQNGEGQCASASARSAVEVLRHTMGVKTVNARGETLSYVRLSAASLYKQVNGGRDGGSSIDDNLEALATVGILPVTGQGFAHEFQDVGFRPAFPSGWNETAKLFRISEWYDIASIEGFVTALILGFPVAYGRDGHAILAVSVTIDSRGKVTIIYLNSWGNWGMAHAGFLYGYGEDSESKIAPSLPGYGAWASRVAVDTSPWQIEV